jgi:putative oxidoreductase
VAELTRDPVILMGRLMLGWLFFMSGWGKLMNYGATVASLINRGVPDWLAHLAPAAEFLGGTLLIVGLATRYAAVLILVFTIIATFIAHRYWVSDTAQVASQYINFWKNVCIIGGTLLLFVTGSGRIAVDALLQRRWRN